MIDEIMLSHAPVLLRRGERLVDDVRELRAEPVEVAASPKAKYVVRRIDRSSS